MITNFIIFGLNVPNWILWVIGGLIIGGGLIFAYLSSREQKETKEAIRDLEKDREKRILGYSHTYGDSLFYGYPILVISVRVLESSKNSKDEITLSSSHPFDFNGEDLRRLKEITVGIIDVKMKNNYELIIKKSPGIHFVVLEKFIMKYIFHHLNNKYAWIGQEALIELNVINDELMCTLPYKTSEHPSLALLLSTIDGINGEHVIAQMMYEGTSFIITKEDSKTWDNLIPAFKTAFSMYFPKGIKLSGNLVE